VGNAHPKEWAEDKKRRLRSYVEGDVGVWSAKARDVCLPGVPLAALLGFAANGNQYNTTCWRVSDEAERQEALRVGRKPFGGDPREGYGRIGSDDLHELGEFGIEGGHCPTPCATDPSCAWVVGAKSEAVRKILDREGVTGARWYKATADNCAIGAWNIARHMESARKKLAEVDPRLSWHEDDKRATLWRSFAGSASWSAGSGGFTKHVRRFAAELAALPEGPRVGRFLQLAARDDDPGNRHRQDEWTALRWAQKHEAAVMCAPWIAAEPWAMEWLRGDGLSDAERDAVYAALVSAST